jgi:hypothetical protein
VLCLTQETLFGKRAARDSDDTCFGISGGNFEPSTCSVYPDVFSTFTGRLGYAFGRALARLQVAGASKP